MQREGFHPQTSKAKAKCSTLLECGTGKIKDTAKDDQNCAGDPCTTADDAQKCCKAGDLQ